MTVLRVVPVHTVDDLRAATGWEIVHPLPDEEWGLRPFFFADRSGNVVNVLSHA